MQRRKFSGEFKIEAVRLVRDGGVSVAQASRDIDVHENVLRKWVQDFGSDPKQAFPVMANRSPTRSKSIVCVARSRSSRRSATF